MKTRILAVSFALLLTTTPAFAVTDTWDGGGANDLFSTALNWVDNTAPASDLVNTDLIFAGATRLTPDLSAPFSADSVTFNNTAGAFSLDGGFLLTIGASGIVNNDTQVQTFTNQVSVGTASASFNAASGPLTFTFTVTVPGGASLSLDGANDFSIRNFLGTGTVTKTGAGDMSFSPVPAPEEVDLVINAGTVNTGVDGSTDTFSSLASIAVNGTSTLNINESLTLNGATLTKASGASVTLASGKTLTADSGGDITITGGFQPSSGSITTVTGAGSTFSASTTFTLGNGAALNVQNGGQFTASGIVALNPTTTINIDGGTVNLGTLQQNGGVVNFTAGAFSFGGGLTVDSAGLLGPNLTLAANRQLTLTGTTTVDVFQTLTLDGGSLSTGALAINGAFAFNKGTLRITGASGFNVGTGTLGSNVALGTGANLQVTSTATVAAGATLTLNGGTFSAGALTNSGTVRANLGTASAGSGTNNSGGRIFIGDTLDVSGTFTNASGARLTLENGAGLLSGAGALSNSGLITGDGTITKPLTNNGTGEVRGEAGRTLSFTGAATNSGQFNLLGGTLDFAAALTNNATGFIAGRGALYTAGLTNNGQIAFSGGTADIHGDVTLAAGSRVVTTGAGTVTTFYDDVVHNGLEIFTGASGSTVFFGNQSGAGPFTGTGTVYYIGDLRPGNSPADVNYGGDLVFSGASSLTLEIGGITPGSQYDRLTIAGSASLDGTLDVSLINGFTPSGGQQFTILTAGSIVNNGFVLAGSAASSFNLLVNSTSVILQAIGLAGDYNHNGVVDAADYVVWRKNNNTGTTLPNDSTPGTDQSDYNLWRAHFGQTAGSGAGASANAAVPEPATLVMLILAAAGLCPRRRLNA